MNVIVISIGGSVFLSKETNADFFKKFSTTIKNLTKRYKIFIVVGGGWISREYIKKGRQLQLDEKFLDKIGIEITRINAYLLSNFLEISNKKIPKTTDDALELDYPLVIMGGTEPGHSTDLVGAELASKTKATKYIIATNVDGIYDKDPNKYPDAKKIKEITIQKLIEKYGTEWDTAGSNIVIDGPALKIIKNKKIPTFVLNGKKLEQIEKTIKDEIFQGTKIII